MRKKIVSFSLLILFVLMVSALLCFPKKALFYSMDGLNLWFNRMIPALLPFMILSGILIRMNLSDRFAALFRPLLKPFLKLSDSCLYVIVIGFLCGFPMGARVCAESLKNKKISEKEASLLLSFCNNIGPVYVSSYVMSLFPTDHKAAILFGLYGIPFLYGLFLRHFPYRDIIQEAPGFHQLTNQQPFFTAVNESILSALDSITVLGGYMIFCDLLNLIPSLFFKNGSLLQATGCLLEITSGLSRLDPVYSALAYPLLTFGGLSCIAQTASCIRETDLSLKNYVFHKIIQTGLCMLYYLILFLTGVR